VLSQVLPLLLTELVLIAIGGEHFAGCDIPHLPFKHLIFILSVVSLVNGGLPLLQLSLPFGIVFEALGYMTVTYLQRGSRHSHR